MNDAVRTTRLKWKRVMWPLPALVSVSAAFPLALSVEPTPSEAKAPGVSHCYRTVCHRVRTVEQTRRLIGRTIVVETSFYDMPGVDRFNTGTYTSNGERFDANDPARVASADLPDGTELLLRNPINGRVSHVRVNDFGPFRGNRRLDVTRRVAEDLDFRHKGVVRLDVIVIAAPMEEDLRYRRDRERRVTRGHLGVVFEGELPALVAGLVAERQPITEHGPVVASVDSSPVDAHQIGNLSMADETVVAQPGQPVEAPLKRIAHSAPDEAATEAAPSNTNEIGVVVFADAFEAVDMPIAATATELEHPGFRPASSTEAFKIAVADADADQHAKPRSDAPQTSREKISLATASLSTTSGLQMGGFVTVAAAASEAGGTAYPSAAKLNLLFVAFAGLLTALFAASLARHRQSGRAAVAGLPEARRAPGLSHNMELSRGTVVAKAAEAPALLQESGAPARPEVTVLVAPPAIEQRGLSVSLIARDLEIQGALRSAGRVEIAGRFTGRIEADEVIVLEGGVLSGDAICRLVEVAGTLTGSISAQEVLVRASGKVDAATETSLLSVEATACLEGHVRRRRMA
jgi:cytoskeletal protein CcmA (bactofilin family)